MSKQSKVIKRVEKDVPFAKNICTCDLSIAKRGDQEDRLFAQNRQIHDNIRRGLTLIYEFDDNSKKIK